MYALRRSIRPCGNWWGDMAKVLVVGATGQLGLDIAQRLVSGREHHVRALSRCVTASAHLFAPSVELCGGDLRDRQSLDRACAGMDVVVATATVVFPKGSYSFDEDEGKGYRNLLKACAAASVRQVVFISLCIPFEGEFVKASKTYQMKAEVENLLKASSMAYTILRCAPFMDDYFALIGSRIPLEGEAAATLNRSSGITAMFRRLFGDSVERRGFAVVPGPVERRHSFVSVSDVSSFVIASIGCSAAYNKTWDIGGPNDHSWQEIAGMYAELLKRTVVVKCIPSRLLRWASRLVSPFSEALANQLAILWIVGSRDTHVNSRGLARKLGVTQTTARDYLARKVATHPSVLV